VNLFHQRGKLAGVMRMVSKHIPSLDELGVPENIKELLGIREGLILVCGTAGSGKSTTIHSMLDHINQSAVHHVLTIENPIEYVFEDQQSMISQREVGKDTPSVPDALKSAIREDANVVMVDSVPDSDTFDQLLNLVETGHLVIAAMQTPNVLRSIERIVNFYPQDARKQVLDRLADDLLLVLAQDLPQRIDTPGLVAVFELMLMNPTIRNVIARGTFEQLHGSIQAAAEEGMITMDRYAASLAEQGIIDQTQANSYIEKES